MQSTKTNTLLTDYILEHIAAFRKTPGSCTTFDILRLLNITTDVFLETDKRPFNRDLPTEIKDTVVGLEMFAKAVMQVKIVVELKNIKDTEDSTQLTEKQVLFFCDQLYRITGALIVILDIRGIKQYVA